MFPRISVAHCALMDHSEATEAADTEPGRASTNGFFRSVSGLKYETEVLDYFRSHYAEAASGKDALVPMADMGGQFLRSGGRQFGIFMLPDRA